MVLFNKQPFIFQNLKLDRKGIQFVCENENFDEFNVF